MRMTNERKDFKHLKAALTYPTQGRFLLITDASGVGDEAELVTVTGRDTSRKEMPTPLMVGH